MFICLITKYTIFLMESYNQNKKPSYKVERLIYKLSQRHVVTSFLAFHHPLA